MSTIGLIDGLPAESAATRQTVRMTAAKILPSDDLEGDEKEVAASILRQNPALGNPYVVQCDWCHQTRTLFRDEHDGPFRLAGHGWFCEPCGVQAGSQEIKI